jgi:hypothetical protein
MALQYDQLGNVIGDFPAVAELAALTDAIKPPTKTSNSPVVKSEKKTTTKPQPDDSSTATNTPAALVSGLAANSATSLKKSNETVSHACDTGTYVNLAIAQVGTIGGQFIRGVREAIKAITTAMGFNPSSSALINQIKKIAGDIKDFTKFVKNITDGIQQFISYVNAIKQMITSILSLSPELLNYFKDCINTLGKQLSASYLAALVSDTSDTTSTTTDTSTLDTINSSASDAKAAALAVGQLAVTSAAAIASVTVPIQINSGNTQMQAAATADVFAAAGYSDSSQNYGGKP